MSEVCDKKYKKFGEGRARKGIIPEHRVQPVARNREVTTTVQHELLFNTFLSFFLDDLSLVLATSHSVLCA
jgi:hypothetical protein